ncbi:MAG TPA: DUF5916 domain-containing protein [Sunxiuqinia sp.]|nr:DUF5916 domain-containing protein [Sunxiuqinia sp.]
MFYQNPALYIIGLFFSLLFANRASCQAPLSYTLSSDTLVNQTASKKRVYFAQFSKGKIRLDGELNEAAWKNGTWSGGFVQQQPDQAKVPTEKTQFCILYDANNLYLGLKCYDNPKLIRSILSRRDEMGGDMAGIAIDSYNDKRTAFEFDVTAAGQKLDLMHLGASQLDYNWDAVWDGKAAIGDSMWTAEIRIPFSQLRFSNKEEQVWGIHVWRWIDRNMEEDHWKLIPVDAPAMVYLFGELRGIKGINSKRNMEFLPYTSAKYSPNTDLENKTNINFGLDGKIGLSSDFTLDYTINPDFGQVEADPSILSLSSYEVFYDEKRPFFLEGNNILNFSTGNDLLFYSRRIGRAPSFTPALSEGETMSMPDNTSIISAVKVTGKNKKGLSLGLVQSFTAKEKATIYSGDTKTDEVVEPFASYFVGRVKQDFNEGNTVLGGMVTSSLRSTSLSQLSFLPSSATVGGLDLQHNWATRKYFLNMKSFYSRVAGSEEAISDLQLASQHYFQRPDATHLHFDPTRTSLEGHGGQVKGGKRSGRFNAIGTFSWRSPGVDLNDLGYMYQADYLEENVELKYQVSKPKGIMRNYWGSFTQNHQWSYGGETTRESLNLHLYTRFTNLWRIHYWVDRDYNIFDTRELRGGPKLYKDSYWYGRFWFQSNYAKDVLIGFGPYYQWSDDGVSMHNVNTFYIRWQINNHINITSETSYIYQVDNNKYVQKLGLSNDETGYLVGQLDRKTLKTTLRLEYFITPEFSIQYYANPYASVGKYADFKRVKNSSNKDMNQRYYFPSSLDFKDNVYNMTDQSSETYKFYNPNFKYQEFRSNLVARWEFRPGSTLYLVWNSSKFSYKYSSDYSVTNSFKDIFGMKSSNVFMIKFNYWFSL